jgi:hypothetical protein
MTYQCEHLGCQNEATRTEYTYDEGFVYGNRFNRSRNYHFCNLHGLNGDRPYQLNEFAKWGIAVILVSGIGWVIFKWLCSLKPGDFGGF